MRSVVFVAAMLVSSRLAVAGPPAYLSSLVVDPQCADPCPVDGVRRGAVSLKTRGGRGFTAQVRLAGVEIGGAPANVGNVQARVSLSLRSGPCATYESPAASIAAGKLVLAFDSQAVTPGLPASFLGTLKVCSVTVVASGVPFAVDGAVLSIAPGP
jgi:hypothetical protein